MIRLICELYLKIKPEALKALVLKGIEKLNFTPHSMDVFFNEFVRPGGRIQYDSGYLTDNLAFKEMDMITSFSLYDKEYSDKHVTPFFRVKIAGTLKDGYTTCLFQWVAYNNLDRLLSENIFLDDLLINAELIYCYCYNHNDAREQTDNNDLHNSPGKSLVVKGFNFMAAPLMLFSEQCNEAIPFEKLLKLNDAQVFYIASKKIIRINLFDLNDDPSAIKNRTKQKEFWGKMDLEKLSVAYGEKNKINAVEYLQSRAAAAKAVKAAKRKK